MWWSISITIGAALLVGGFGIHSRRLSRKLGEVSAYVDELEAQVEWLKGAIVRHGLADPDLDDLDRVFNPVTSPDG